MCAARCRSRRNVYVHRMCTCWGSRPMADSVLNCFCRFNFSSAKSKVFKQVLLAENTPGSLKKFFASALYDRMLHNLMLYFIAIFQKDVLAKNLDKARRHHLEGYNPHAGESCSERAHHGSRGKSTGCIALTPRPENCYLSCFRVADSTVVQSQQGVFASSAPCAV